MKIVFLCGSLQTGRDGVGDYTRKLAEQLNSNGHQAFLLSINDRWIDLDINCDGDLPVYRISSTDKLINRLLKAKRWIDEIKPDVVSLQFVPYSFNTRGLPLQFLLQIKKIAKIQHWQIMFHELWLDKPINFREKITQLLQKNIILLGIKTIQPKWINVSIDFNQKRLEQSNVSSTVLSLFGNIIPSKRSITTAEDSDDNKPIQILFFGGSPKGTYLQLLIGGIKDFCQKSNRKIKLVVVSSESANKANFLKAIDQQLSLFDLVVENHSFLDDDSLSEVISNSTVGIARSETYLLGKSGAAMAMLEHGIPIWLPKWKNNQPFNFPFRSSLIYSDLYSAILHSVKQPYYSLLPDVARQFTSQFGFSEKVPTTIPNPKLIPTI